MAGLVIEDGLNEPLVQLDGSPKKTVVEKQ
jgi:hypothetical protein